MSCVVGYKDEKGRVWLCGESKVVASPDYRTVVDETARKVKIYGTGKNRIALATVGDTFQGEIANRILALILRKQYASAKTLTEKLAVELLREVKRLTEAGYLLDKRDEKLLDLDMLIAYKKSLFFMDGGMNYNEVVRFTAIGVAQPSAEAAILAAEKLLPKPPQTDILLRTTLETVCRLYPGLCCEPIYIEGPF